MIPTAAVRATGVRHRVKEVQPVALRRMARVMSVAASSVTSRPRLCASDSSVHSLRQLNLNVPRELDGQ
ncbi:hypothetical protein ACU4GD_16530 [Cupriavidus basilensis]